MTAVEVVTCQLGRVATETVPLVVKSVVQLVKRMIQLWLLFMVSEGIVKVTRKCEESTFSCLKSQICRQLVMPSGEIELQFVVSPFCHEFRSCKKFSWLNGLTETSELDCQKVLLALYDHGCISVYAFM